MWAKRIAGLLLAALVFTNGASAAAFAGGLHPAVVPAADATAQSAAPTATAAPADRAEGLEYLPRGEGRRGGGVLGWVLIAAAVVLAIVIVVFIVRHRRSGRAG